MNKAFVREPDDTGQGHCPRCGSLGTTVGPETLPAQLPADALHGLAESAFFCPFPHCEVVYFDMFERVVAKDALARPVYPKDTDAPICGCFGLTAADIDQDIAEGCARRVRELLAKAKSPQAQCAIKSINGQSCVAEVQRYFMKLHAAK